MNIDLIMVLAYFVVIFLIGIYKSGKQKKDAGGLDDIAGTYAISFIRINDAGVQSLLRDYNDSPTNFHSVPSDLDRDGDGVDEDAGRTVTIILELTK